MKYYQLCCTIITDRTKTSFRIKIFKQKVQGAAYQDPLVKELKDKKIFHYLSEINTSLKYSSFTFLFMNTLILEGLCTSLFVHRFFGIECLDEMIWY
jgi:hypothetical protein